MNERDVIEKEFDEILDLIEEEDPEVKEYSVSKNYENLDAEEPTWKKAKIKAKVLVDDIWYCADKVLGKHDVSQGIYEYNEEVKEGNREYWIKTKTKEYKNYNTDPVIRCYIPRPCEDNMLSEALEELDGYIWACSEGSIEIDINEKDFDEIIQSEVAKEL